MSDESMREVIELNERIEQLDDPRAGYALVRDRINQRRHAGQPVPEDLKRLERSLLTDCLVQSQGR
ncbi:MAG: hypothetical protein NW205_05185 [Hyphomicrobiaceae bacterium]|nr:hypothetical protein [Hyphomicrobiaceae bacterium]